MCVCCLWMRGGEKPTLPAASAGPGRLKGTEKLFESSDEKDHLRAHRGRRVAVDTLTKRPHVENSLSLVDAAA